MNFKHAFASALLLTATAGSLIAQSPAAETSTDIGGKKITIKYSAPSMRNRKIFGAGGVISNDDTYPVWRAGANAATALHTDADLTIGDLKVPKGDYTIYVLADPTPWKLIINKQTGQGGTEYHQDRDLGRVTMQMSKPAKPIETYKMTLSSSGGGKGKLTLEWENVVASVDFTAR
jgi:Protein of unknown function (DUF2911)